MYYCGVKVQKGMMIYFSCGESAVVVEDPEMMFIGWRVTLDRTLNGWKDNAVTFEQVRDSWVAIRELNVDDDYTIVQVSWYNQKDWLTINGKCTKPVRLQPSQSFNCIGAKKKKIE